MTPTGLSLDRRTEWLFFGGLVFLALLMSLKYFPGLEGTSAYSGNVFQAIYPDAFPGDPYIGTERPILKKSFQLSLFYIGPKIMGEIWLDDRFAFLVYLVLVVLTLVGIDRIVRLAGISDIAPRLAIQLIFMRDHQYLTLTMTFANQPDLNHAAFVIPSSVWLIYATLSRKPLWMVLGLCVLTASLSIRMAPYVIAFCLIIAAINGNHRDRIAVGAVFVAALMAFVYAVVYVFPISPADKLVLWDLIHHQVEKFDSNPFYPRPDALSAVIKNIVFGAIMAAALLAPVPESTVMRGMKIFVGLGTVAWLVGGLYFSFAPDALKLVHVFPFSLVRNLRWPQTMAYLVIMISIVFWLTHQKGLRDIVGATMIFLCLLVIGPGNHELWALLFVLSCFAVVSVRFVSISPGSTHSDVLGRVHAISGEYPLLLAQTLTLTIGIAFASTLWKKLPEWQTWAVHGIHGNSPVSKWIGVDDYIRRNTPADVVVLPLEEEAPGDGLKARRHFASRSGRTIPVFMEYSSIFDLDGWKIEREQIALMDRFQKATKRQDWRTAAAELNGLILKPDYIILHSRFLNDAFFKYFPFVEETRVRRFAVLRRKKGRSE